MDWRDDDGDEHWRLLDMAGTTAVCRGYRLPAGGYEVRVSVGETLHSAVKLPDAGESGPYVKELLLSYLRVGWKHEDTQGK